MAHGRHTAVVDDEVRLLKAGTFVKTWVFVMVLDFSTYLYLTSQARTRVHTHAQHFPYRCSAVQCASGKKSKRVSLMDGQGIENIVDVGDIQSAMVALLHVFKVSSVDHQIIDHCLDAEAYILQYHSQTCWSFHAPCTCLCGFVMTVPPPPARAPFRGLASGGHDAVKHATYRGS